MLNKFLFSVVLLFIYVINGFFAVKSDQPENKSFVPSHEWQKIEDGQILPAGLHVRINLHTGAKEAKLPDKNDNSKSLITTKKKDFNEGVIHYEQLKETMKNIKADDPVFKDNVKKKFRSYEEIKKDLNQLHMNIKSDIEIVTDLIETFRKFKIQDKNSNNSNSEWSSDEEILSVLTDLEYLVHQHNNALEFARLNGFSDVVYKCLNSSSSQIRSEALLLLGSATQSNPKVQIAALDSGGVNLLLNILMFDESIQVKSRGMYALSCLTRRFPVAQEKLIKYGGLTVFAKIFDEEKQDLFKLQVKIINLIHDLLFERKDTKMSILEESDKNHTNLKLKYLQDKYSQYERINLESFLVEQDWCKRISDWFLKQNLAKEIDNNILDTVNSSENLETHSLIEQVVDTLFVLSDICKDQFQVNIDFINLLNNLKNVYFKLSKLESEKTNDESSQFYSGLSNILKLLTEKVKKKMRQDEL